MSFEQRARELVAKMTLAEKVEQMKFNAPAIDRLNIPAYNWWNEALHGVARAGCATVFPQAIGMAASFNDELLNKVKLTNKGDFDTAYSVLKFEYIPHKNLCGLKKVFIKKDETKIINF